MDLRRMFFPHGLPFCLYPQKDEVREEGRRRMFLGTYLFLKQQHFLL